VFANLTQKKLYEDNMIKNHQHRAKQFRKRELPVILRSYEMETFDLR